MSPRVLLLALLATIGFVAAAVAASHPNGRLFDLRQLVDEGELEFLEVGLGLEQAASAVTRQAEPQTQPVQVADEEESAEGVDGKYAHQVLSAEGVSKSGGAGKCIACVLMVSLLEQYAMEHSVSLSYAADAVCGSVTAELPSMTGLCQLFLGGTIAKVEADFAARRSPDVSCRTSLDWCASEPQQCALFPVWPLPDRAQTHRRLGAPSAASSHARFQYVADSVGKLLNVHAVSDELLNTRLDALLDSGMVSEVLNAKRGGSWIPVPIPDLDKDKYSSLWTYRGLQFRGADCDDKNATVYPGRNAMQGDFDASADSNCNGIWGVDSNSGIAWEQALCGDTQSRGLLAIGDSATAHFSLPPSFVTPSSINATTYSRLIETLISEVDWPQCSWSTGWGNSTICPQSKVPLQSIYERMRERNLCMHRDYVNAGVNGASVNNIIDDGVVTPSNYTGALQALPTRYKVDGPSTVLFSMIGNDICHAHAWGEYTPVDVFTTKAVEVFRYLDTVLHPGSHVVIMGLVDGRVLYDTLKDAIHPIGATYTQFYDYLNCLKTSPCWGWMNSNSTVRDASTARAQEYNAAYEQIIASTQFNNFDLHYFFPDYAQVIANWTAAGNSALDLIEPVDGFHPSTTGNALLAAAYWQWLSVNVPQALNDVNPNNADIQRMFGDQGGYGY